MDDDRINKAVELSMQANQRLDGHETLCAERYNGILTRSARLEYILYAIIAILLLGEGTVLEVIKRLAGVK